MNKSTEFFLARLIPFGGVFFITMAICIVLKLIDGSLSASTAIIIYLLINAHRVMVTMKELIREQKIKTKELKHE